LRLGEVLPGVGELAGAYFELSFQLDERIGSADDARSVERNLRLSSRLLAPLRDKVTSSALLIAHAGRPKLRIE
jgi:hypothetical protein